MLTFGEFCYNKCKNRKFTTSTKDILLFAEKNLNSQIFIYLSNKSQAKRNKERENNIKIFLKYLNYLK